MRLFVYVCVCVGVFSHPFSGASESFIVTPNLTQQDKMLPSALLFSALSLSSHSLSPFFFFVFVSGWKKKDSRLLRQNFKLNSAVLWRAGMNPWRCYLHAVMIRF